MNLQLALLLLVAAAVSASPILLDDISEERYSSTNKRTVTKLFPVKTFKLYSPKTTKSANEQKNYDLSYTSPQEHESLKTLESKTFHPSQFEITQIKETDNNIIQEGGLIGTTSTFESSEEESDKVFVQLSETGISTPTSIYLLKQKEKLLGYTNSVKSPQVYLVHYNEDQNIALPGGVDLKEALVNAVPLSNLETSEELNVIETENAINSQIDVSSLHIPEPVPIPEPIISEPIISLTISEKGEIDNSPETVSHTNQYEHYEQFPPSLSEIEQRNHPIKTSESLIFVPSKQTGASLLEPISNSKSSVKVTTVRPGKFTEISTLVPHETLQSVDIEMSKLHKSNPGIPKSFNNEAGNVATNLEVSTAKDNNESNNIKRETTVLNQTSTTPSIVEESSSEPLVNEIKPTKKDSKPESVSTFEKQTPEELITIKPTVNSITKIIPEAQPLISDVDTESVGNEVKIENTASLPVSIITMTPVVSNEQVSTAMDIIDLGNEVKIENTASLPVSIITMTPVVSNEQVSTAIDIIDEHSSKQLSETSEDNIDTSTIARKTDAEDIQSTESNILKSFPSKLDSNKDSSSPALISNKIIPNSLVISQDPDVTLPISKVQVVETSAGKEGSVFEFPVVIPDDAKLHDEENELKTDEPFIINLIDKENTDQISLKNNIGKERDSVTSDQSVIDENASIQSKNTEIPTIAVNTVAIKPDIMIGLELDITDQIKSFENISSVNDGENSNEESSQTVENLPPPVLIESNSRNLGINRNPLTKNIVILFRNKLLNRASNLTQNNKLVSDRTSPQKLPITKSFDDISQFRPTKFTRNDALDRIIEDENGLEFESLSSDSIGVKKEMSVAKLRTNDVMQISKSISDINRMEINTTDDIKIKHHDSIVSNSSNIGFNQIKPEDILIEQAALDEKSLLSTASDKIIKRSIPKLIHEDEKPHVPLDSVSRTNSVIPQHKQISYKILYRKKDDRATEENAIMSTNFRVRHIRENDHIKFISNRDIPADYVEQSRFSGKPDGLRNQNDFGRYEEPKRIRKNVGKFIINDKSSADSPLIRGKIVKGNIHHQFHRRKTSVTNPTLSNSQPISKYTKINLLPLEEHFSEISTSPKSRQNAHPQYFNKFVRQRLNTSKISLLPLEEHSVENSTPTTQANEYQYFNEIVRQTPNTSIKNNIRLLPEEIYTASSFTSELKDIDQREAPVNYYTVGTLILNRARH